MLAERDSWPIGAVAEDRAKQSGRPGRRLEGDQLRLRPAGKRERAELTLVGADVDHGGGFDPDNRRPVLDRGDDGMRKRIPMAGVPRRAQRALTSPDCAHRPVMPVWGVNFPEPGANIGTQWGGARVGQYVYSSVGAGSDKKK